MKKDKQFSIRISAQDLETIRRKAAQAHMSQSDYVTACCLGKRIVILDGLKEVLRQQKAIGNNLNQLTVLANMGKVQFANLDSAVQEFAKINTALREMQEGGAVKIAIVHFVNYKKGTQTRGCMKSVMRYVSQTEQNALGWTAARQRHWLSAGNGVRRIPEYEAAAPQRRRRDVLPHGAELPERRGH